jgi:hypothetical protein
MESTEDPTRQAVLETPLEPPPRVVLEAPPSVRDIIEGQAAGLRRIKVSIVHGRNNAHKVGAVRLIGASATLRPNPDVLELAIEHVMRLVSYSIEERGGDGGTFRIQPFHLKDGKTQRGKSRDVTFSGLYDDPGGSGPSAGDVTPENVEMLRYLAAQNRHTLNVLGEARLMMQEARQTIRGVGAYAEAVTGRLTEALVAERDANHARTEAERETMRATGEHDLELEKLKQRAQFLEMFAPVMGQVSSDMGVKAAEALGVGTAKKPTKAASANPLARTKLQAAEGSEQTETEPEPEVDPELERLRELKEDHPELFAASMLKRSLSDEQQAQIRNALGAEASAAFDRACSSSTNEECLAELERMTDLSAPDATPKVLAVLNGKQQGVISTLRFAVMRRRGEL